jgi:hypothetical protein
LQLCLSLYAQAKLSRVEAVEEQRTVLMTEMQRIKKAMQEQELRMRQVRPATLWYI